MTARRGGMDIIFFLVITVLFFSFTALQVVILRRWRGGWRAVGGLPGIALLLVILNILVGTLRDRTSHNLWPLEIVMWSAGGLVFLGVLSLIRKRALTIEST
jgi:hypothetical protein